MQIKREGKRERKGERETETERVEKLKRTTAAMTAVGWGVD